MASRSAMYRNQDYKTSMNTSNSNLDSYSSQQQLGAQVPYAQRSSAQSDPYAQQLSVQGGNGQYQMSSQNANRGPYAQQQMNYGPYAQRSSAQSNPYSDEEDEDDYDDEVPYAMENHNRAMDPRWKNNEIHVERVPNNMYPSVIRDNQEYEKHQMLLQQQKQQEMKRRYYENYKNHIVNDNDNDKYNQQQAFYKRSSAASKATNSKYNPSMKDIVDNIFSSASQYIEALDDKNNDLNPIAEAMTNRKLDCSNKLTYIIIIIILCVVIFLLVYKLFKKSKSD
jgi:hypothetical protein